MNDDTEVLTKVLIPFIQLDTSINPSQGVFPSSRVKDFLDNVATKLGYQHIELPPSPWYKDPLGKEKVYPLLYYKQATTDKTPIVLFLGHHDVVPVPSSEVNAWKYPPFEGVVEGDRVYGRGALDMKGAVTAFLTAFANVHLTRGTIIIAISGDEETGGNSSVPLMLQVLKQHDLMPNYVINGEPSFTPVIVTKRRGTTILRVRFPLEYRDAFGKIQQLTFESKQGNNSETLHTALFTLGADSHAVFTASKIASTNKIVSLHTSSQKWNSVPKTVTIEYVEEPINKHETPTKTQYSHGLTTLLQALPSLPSLSLPTEKSLFGVSIGPNVYHTTSDGMGELFIDIRSMILNDHAHHGILKAVQQHFQSFNPQITVTLESSINSMINSRPSPLFDILKQKALENDYRISMIGEKLGGASDSRYFTSLHIPTAELGPQGQNAHGPNEWVSLSSLLKLTKIYRETALSLLEKGN